MGRFEVKLGFDWGEKICEHTEVDAMVIFTDFGNTQAYNYFKPIKRRVNLVPMDKEYRTSLV